MKYWVWFTVISALVSCSESPNVEDQEGDNATFEEVVQESTPLSQVSNTGSKVIDSLNTYLMKNPSDVDALALRSDAYLQNKNLQYAIADAEAAMAIDSTSTKALLAWGEVNYFQNKTRISRDAWKECARIDKNSVECRIKLAELFHIVGEFEKSLEIASEVIDIDENNATAYLIKGLDYRDGNGDTITALRYIQKAIDLKQDYFEAIEHAALLYTYLGDPLAEAYYKRMLELEPNNYLVYYNYGIYFYNIEDWNGALESLTKAIQFRPNDPEAFLTMGMIYLKIKEYQDAKQYFTWAIEKSPSQANYRAYYSRGYTYEMLGNTSNAISDYQQARVYNPTHEPTRIALQRLSNL